MEIKKYFFYYSFWFRLFFVSVIAYIKIELCILITQNTTKHGRHCETVVEKKTTMITKNPLLEKAEKLKICFHFV